MGGRDYRLPATLGSYRAAGTPTPAPTKLDQAVERVLAGEALWVVGDELDIWGEERREVVLRGNRLKPKPRGSRRREVFRRWL